MHELGLVNYVVKEVDKIAKEKGVENIKTVTLEFGEVSGIVSAYLYDYWNWYTKKYHLLEGTTLKCEEIPAVTWCDDCKITYSTIAYGKTCPHCGSGNTWLLRGNEMRIKSIEIVEPDSGEEGKEETLEAGGEYRP
ncbi:MAG: hydrogenase maturation nickel metallochaperone HypA [Mogibacterium sp.]|nr:hydrogenase maturation nickel metallochaperone HypA [Mogibacterium sp.]